LTEEDDVLSALFEVSQRVKEKMVLFCTTDVHVQFVSRNREVLKRLFEFVLPDHATIDMLMDKRKFYDFAQSHQFSVPKTMCSKNQIDFEKIASIIPYPCIVKPTYRTAYWSKKFPLEKKVIKADSQRELKQKLDDPEALDQPLVFQEWIPGDDQQVYFCLAYIDSEGKFLALFTGKKLRQYPSLTGNTSIAESIRQQKLVDITKELFRTAQCIGLCSLEFKYDALSDSFKITEPTIGRVDLQEGISTQAGLDIPFIAYQDAIKISQPFQSNYRIGLKWINEPFELNAFLTQRRINGYSAGQFFHPYHGQRSFAVMAWDDPKPFLFFLKRACERGGRYLKKVLPLFRDKVRTSNEK
jgi:predicted ATP-grasp superfamily ATP-dependent carboligase